MNLAYIHVLRSLSMICIVIYHTYGFVCSPSFFPQSAKEYHDIYYWVNNCVYTWPAMILFTMISGFLFNYLYEQGRYDDFWRFCKKKAVRLLLPCFTFAILMRLISGGSIFTTQFIVDIVKGKLYILRHLWYLPAIFWCLIAGWFFKRYLSNIFCLILAQLFFLTISLLPPFIPSIIGTGWLQVYMGWFLLGMLLYPLCIHVMKINTRRGYVVIAFIILYAIQAYYFPVSYPQRTWYSILFLALVCMGTWALFLTMGERLLKLCHPLIVLSKYSFGIYIFHHWVATSIIHHAAKLCSLETWAAHHLILFPLCLTIIVFLVSLFLTHYSTKTKLGRILLS